MNLNNATKNVTSNHLSLFATIGFGVVVVGAGYLNMQANLIIEGSGVAIIFVDMLLWCLQKRFNPELNKKEVKKKRIKLRHNYIDHSKR